MVLQRLHTACPPKGRLSAVSGGPTQPRRKRRGAQPDSLPYFYELTDIRIRSRFVPQQRQSLRATGRTGPGKSVGLSGPRKNLGGKRASALAPYVSRPTGSQNIFRNLGHVRSPRNLSIRTHVQPAAPRNAGLPNPTEIPAP